MRKKKAYLEVLLKDEIVEGVAERPFISRKARTSLYDIVQALHHAAKDPDISALALSIEPLNTGWARLSDLRRAVSKFRNSGKQVYCFLQEGGNAEYYLASASDRIFMPPAAHLHLVGLSAETFFFRNVLDRFGIEAELFSIGEYKSAAEMFTRMGMSEPAREQLERILDDSFEELCRAFEDRGFSREDSTALMDDGPYTAREAVARKLIDGICYQDELAGKMEEIIGKKARAVAAARYPAGDGLVRRILTFRRSRIAVIDVTGHIETGESRRNQAGREVAGADTIRKFLDHAERSRITRAIIIRIDSPGGSGIASDLIWRKISLVNKKKPVVVSFGDVAASGGYYIAAPAGRIIAEPTSITGSIGVLAGKFVARGLIESLGIRREAIARGKHAGYDSVFTNFTPDEEEKLRQQLSEFYREDFVKKVAEGRKISEQEVDEAGRGRVWTGKRAVENRLVDELGGLMEAVQRARESAGIPERAKVRVVHYYRHRRLWERLMPGMRPPLLALDLIERMERLATQGILLEMPFSIRIR